MQPVNWYMSRLRAMSPEEVTWRAYTTLRNQVDRLVTPLRRRSQRWVASAVEAFEQQAPPFRVCDLSVGELMRAPQSEMERAWCRHLRERADRIAAGQLSFFDLQDHDLGNPIDWNRDHKSGRAAPLRRSPSIDYRDFQVTGDCKFVWEPNRHHQLVVLGRAYRATGEQRYAAAVEEQLHSWLRQCPYGLGMNWRSPLELGIRLINWVWAVDLIREARVADSLRADWLEAVYWHLREITRQYSRGSSIGNHRVGEAAGVFVASSYLPFLRKARRWRLDSRRILEEAILQQTHPDGGPREQALGYHLFNLQFFLLAALVARWTAQDFSERYWARMKCMFEFLAALQAGGETSPMFGDCDDGYVLDLGAGPPDTQTIIAIGEALYPHKELADADGRPTEAVRWLMGRAARRGRAATEGSPATLRSRAFRQTGYYLLQSGHVSSDDRISVVFDCGPLGFPPLAGHGHADALSFTLRAFGEDVLVDPGTYDYFSYSQWRPYFRSTRAHNTIVVDDQNQSEIRGPFLWSKRARTRCLCWEPTASGGRVVGEHDGYSRLPQPVLHRRTIELDGQQRELLIRDELLGTGIHDVAAYWHLAEHCRVVARGPHSLQVDTSRGAITIDFDPRLVITELTGSHEPIGGWVSRGYHRKSATTTLVGSYVLEGNGSLICRIKIGAPRCPAVGAGASRHHAAAHEAGRRGCCL